MPDLPISGLPAATTPLGGTEEVPVVQGGVTSKTTVNDIQVNVSTLPAASVPLSGTDEVLVNQAGDNKKATVSDVSFNINTLPAGTTPVAGTEPVAIYQGGLNKQVTVNDIQIQIDGLTLRPAPSELTDVFVAERAGVKYKYRLNDIQKQILSAVTLQGAYNNGNEILTKGSPVKIGEDNFFSSPILFECIDKNSKNGLTVDNANELVTSNFDLEFKNTGTALGWGNFGATSLFKWTSTLNSVRAGRATVTQFDSVNIGNYSFAFGQDITAPGAYNLSAGRDISLGTGSDLYALGKDITVANGSNNVVAVGDNINVSTGKSNSFVFCDGSVGAFDAESANSFNVRCSTSVNFDTASLTTTAEEFVFDKVIDTLGSYRPCVIHRALVTGNVVAGAPLTVDSSPVVPFGLRQVTAADPNDQPIVAIATEAGGFGEIKVCGASLVGLNKQSTTSINQGDPLDKSNSQDGAVKPVSGSSGAFAVAAETVGVGPGIIYAWLKRSEL